MNARIGYGTPAALAGRGVLTPYASMSLSAEGFRRMSMGGRFDVGPSLNASLEGSRSRMVRSAIDHAVMLRGGLNW